MELILMLVHISLNEAKIAKVYDQIVIIRTNEANNDCIRRKEYPNCHNLTCELLIKRDENFCYLYSFKVNLLTLFPPPMKLENGPLNGKLKDKEDRESNETRRAIIEQLEDELKRKQERRILRDDTRHVIELELKNVKKKMLTYAINQKRKKVWVKKHVGSEDDSSSVNEKNKNKREVKEKTKEEI
nr:unnamed protein product [Callosobruchus chinensis]